MNLFLLLYFGISSDRFKPTNPKYHKQFYTINTGQNYGVEGEDINLLNTWEDRINGNGISIELYSTPCNGSVPSLRGRVLSECSGIQNSKPEKCNFVDSDDTGTSLASIIAANYNSDCGLGIAYGSSLYCNPLIKNKNEQPTKEQLKTALSEDQMINIKSFPFSGQSQQGSVVVNNFDPAEEEEISRFFYFGRGGLGGIAVFTPQTEGVGIDPNFNYITQTRFPINVAASTFRGNRAFYSASSSNYLINVPSTDSSLFYGSDLLTSPIYSTGDSGKCGFHQDRLAAANAIATGGIALILQRNKFISLRALQLVLELSATVNDANDTSWITNAAGFMYSNIYGFGRLNVDRALEIVEEVATRLPMEILDFSSVSLKEPVIPSCRQSPLIITHTIPERINFIESVTVQIETTHNNLGDLHIELESPSGTKVIIIDFAATQNVPSDPHVFTFNCRQFLGEKAGGDWKLMIGANGCIATGRLIRTSINVYGMKNFRPTNKDFDSEDDRPDRPDHDLRREPYPLPETSKKLRRNRENNDYSETYRKHSDSDEDMDPRPPRPDIPISQLYPKEIRPSVLKLYPESKDLWLDVVSTSRDTKCSSNQINPLKEISFSLNSHSINLDSPAGLFFISEDDNNIFPPIFFEHASDINKQKIFPPAHFTNPTQIEYIIDIIESPTRIYSKHSKTLKINPITQTWEQYQVVERYKDVVVPYQLQSESSYVWVTLSDYDTQSLLARNMQQNIGRITFQVDDPSTQRALLTIQAPSDDPCNIIVNAMYVGYIPSEKPFPINESTTCPNLEGLAYQEPPELPTDITTDPPVSDTTTPTSNYRPDDPNFPEEEEKGTSKSVVIYVSIFSGLLVVVILASIVLVILFKKRRQAQNESYFNADPETTQTSTEA